MQKRVWSFLLVVAMCLTMLPTTALAAGGNSGSISWNFEDGTLTITGSGEITSKPWTTGSDAITISEIEKVVIGAGITAIGGAGNSNGIFYACTNLTTVEFEAESNLETIGSAAFNGCESLTTIEIPSSVKTIKNLAFSKCTGLTNITIPSDVTTIGDNAFSSSGLTEVTIPSKVTSIGSAVFSGCKALTKVTFEENVTSIGQAMFDGCTSLTNITIPSSVKTIGNQAFQNCTSLTSITIPSGVETIGDYAFQYCTNLETVTFDGDVGTIGKNAFASLSSLREVTFKGNVTKIGDATFGGCNNLKITFAGNVGEFGQYPFGNCRDLEITFQGDPPKGLNSNSFVGATITKVYYPAENEKWKEVVDNNSSLPWTPIGSDTQKPYTLIDNVMTILDADAVMTDYNSTDNRAPWYDERSDIKEVVFPEGVTTIGAYAFDECDQLENITIPSGVKTIGRAAFQGLSKLTTVDFEAESELETIGFAAFEGCTSLTNITIPGNVTTIGDWAFFDCEGLTNIIIPNSVTTIGSKAFSESKLTTVTFEGNVDMIGDFAFQNCTSLETVTFDGDVKTIGKNAFNVSEDMKANLKKDMKVTFNGNVGTIDESAFDGFSSLKEVTFNSNVEHLGKYAFARTGLQKITFKENASTNLMGEDAFGGVDAIVYYPGDSSWDTVKNNHYGGTLYWMKPGSYTYTAETQTLTIHTQEAVQDYHIQSAVQDYQDGKAPWCREVIGKDLDGNNIYMKEKINHIVIEDGVTRIGSYAFRDCGQLEDIDIRGEITSIGDGAFQLTGMGEITIPASVTEIGSNAFMGCPDLRTIIFEGNAPTTIAEDCFANGLGFTVNANAYYPKDGNWTADKMQKYGAESLTWIANPRTVTFYKNADDENEVYQEQILDVTRTTGEAKDTASEPTDPTWEDHTFGGWYKDKEYTQQYTFNAEVESDIVTGDLKLYAKWTPITYTITWKNYDGTVLKEETVAYGETPEYSGTPTREADAQHTYTFKDWDPKVTTVTGNATYTATYSSDVRKYTVMWKDYDDSVLKEETVAYGEIPKYSGTPTREATAEYTYTFESWTPTVSAVTGDAIYKATYKVTTNQYTISFDSKGGTAVAPVTVDYGAYVSAPAAPTKEGYDFQGWYKNEGYTEAYNFESETVTGDRTLYAKWTEAIYTVTLNAQGGTINSGDVANYTYGEGATLPTDVTKKGYTFEGWYEKADCTGAEVKVIGTEETGNKEFYAKWEANTYKVTLNKNGGEIAEGKNVTNYIYGVGATLPTKNEITRTGYTFAGWYEDENFNGEAITAIGATDTGEKKYYAKWEVNTYKVTLNPNGGEIAEGKDVTSYTYGTVTLLPTADEITRTGHTFDGWYTDENFSGDPVTVIGEEETDDKTFYAKWKPIKYTITWENEGGTVLETDQVAYGEIPEYTGQTPTKEATDEFSYTFKGWSPEVTAVTGNATYTATYDATINQYTIDFDSNGGSAVDAQTVDYGTTATKPDDPTRSGYNFKGWYTDEKYTNEYNFSTPVTTNLTLYAKWASRGSVVVPTEPDKPDTSRFTDVAEDAWYADAVDTVVEMGLMVGISDTEFAPDATLTRAELAQILYNRAGQPAVSSMSTFTDVPASAWYAKAVAWAQQNNVVSGIGNNQFAPNQIVTREQIAVMLHNEAGKPEVSGTITGFADVEKVSDWAYDAVLWATQNGVLNGAQQADGTLCINPTHGATRAEAAALLANYYTK